MTTQQTCDQCHYYEAVYGPHGTCNRANVWYESTMPANGFFVEGIQAEAVLCVGPKFGCVQWLKKE